MKNLKYFLLVGVLVLSTGFIPVRDILGTKTALHVLANMGRKAWISFNDAANTRFSRITKFGFNKDVDSAAIEVLASFGGGFVQRSISAETLTIVSTDAADDVGGTGARTILLGCIGADGLETSLNIVMDGLTPVITTETCKFINRGAVTTSGTGLRNAGTISIIQTSSGIQLAEIPAEKSATQQLIYYVPSDRRCYMEQVNVRARKIAGGASPRVEFNVLVYSTSQDTIYDVREYFVDTSVENDISVLDFKAEQVRPNEILAIEVITNTDNTIATGSFELTCRKD